MTTLWYTRAALAKKLRVRQDWLPHVEGYKALRTRPVSTKGRRGKPPLLFFGPDVEKLHAKRDAVPKQRRIAAKKTKKKPTSNQQKIRAANEGLLSSSSPVVKEVQRCIAKLKQLDPSISSVRVEIDRHSKEVVE